jgi:hypothetical protein
MSKDVIIFIGIVVRGVLAVDVLKDKATELVEKWPALGGKFITKVLDNMIVQIIPSDKLTLIRQNPTLLPLEMASSISKHAKFLRPSPIIFRSISMSTTPTNPPIGLSRMAAPATIFSILIQ